MREHLGLFVGQLTGPVGRESPVDMITSAPRLPHILRLLDKNQPVFDFYPRADPVKKQLQFFVLRQCDRAKQLLASLLGDLLQLGGAAAVVSMRVHLQGDRGISMAQTFGSVVQG